MKICFTMKISFQQMVNQIKNENISNSEDATDRLIIQKIQMKVLPIKTMTVTIIILASKSQRFC